MRRSRQFTALHYGIENGADDCVRLLLQYGANFNLAAVGGLTPAHLAQRKVASGPPDQRQAFKSCLGLLEAAMRAHAARAAVRVAPSTTRPSMQHASAQQRSPPPPSAGPSSEPQLGRVLASLPTPQPRDRLAEQRAQLQSVHEQQLREADRARLETEQRASMPQPAAGPNRGQSGPRGEGAVLQPPRLDGDGSCASSWSTDPTASASFDSEPASGAPPPRDAEPPPSLPALAADDDARRVRQKLSDDDGGGGAGDGANGTIDGLDLAESLLNGVEEATFSSAELDDWWASELTAK